MRRRQPALALALSLLATAAAADVHPNTEGGLAVNQAVEAGELDNVNLFNGVLTLTIPLGISYPVGGSLAYRFTLLYNANPWMYTNSPDGHARSAPSTCGNAGLGWRVSFGSITPSTCVETDNTANSAQATYEAPDGSQHLLYANLHPGEPTDPNYLYSRDGTYLRLHRVGLNGTDVEFPDGTVHNFNIGGSIAQIHDRFGNQVTFTYFATTAQCAGSPSCTRVSDSQGRTHWVYFGADSISRIDLAAFGGLRAIYGFNYRSATVARACPNTDTAFGDVAVNLLDSLTLPDGSTYSPGPAGYITATAGAGHCVDGSANLTGVTLPTLGRIGWTYQTYSFPTGGRRGANQGIATRSLLDAGGGLIGTWTYTTAQTPEFLTPSIELVNSVRDPAGNTVKRYFSTGPDNAVSGYGPGPNLFDYGRQYTPKTTAPFNSNLFLSEQVFDAGNTLRRTEWVRYERDQIGAGLNTLPDASNNNGRLAARTTVFDDGSRASSVDQDFDGVGHYRYRSTGGTFPGNNLRAERHHFNPARFTYAVNQSTNTLTTTYNVVPTSDPWVLGTQQFEWEQENGVTQFRAYCYDPATGFLKRQRSYLASTQDPAALSWNDAVEVYGADAQGNVVSEASYGGDVSPFPPASADLCLQTLPAAPEYQVYHAFLYGVRYRTQYAGTGFYSLDRDIDAATGMVAVSRDTAGIATRYTYDTLGRMTLVQPRDTANTVYTYTRATSPSSLSSVNVDRVGNSSVPLARTQTLFDSLGRAIEEDLQMPDSTWSPRTTAYDALGRKTAVSETGRPGSVTQYLNYDAFGRPGTVRPPEGSGHDVTLTYSGFQTINRTVRLGTQWNGSTVTESPATTTETYDRFGRLASVAEPSGSGGTNVTTSYGYDAGNRLSSVSTSTAGVTQTRTFTYDLRGFLAWESHPERGANSLGAGHSVDYLSYDSRGHARRRVEGTHDLSMTFDVAERPLVTYTTGGPAFCAAGSSTCVKELSYDGNAASLGRVFRASRFNHIVLGGAPHTIKMEYTYFYNGPDGRISRRDLQHIFDGVGSTDPSKEAFTQSFTYTLLGDMDTETYPDCKSTFTFCGNTVGRAVQDTYTKGFLTGVTNYTGGSGIQYYANGMVSQVTHSNGVVTSYANDPFGRVRPSSITATDPAATVLWSSGPYAYDGGANVTQIGQGYYVYDGVSRLSTAVVQTNPVHTPPANTLASQSTFYDAFGNIQAFSNRATPTNSANNHLTGGTYDSSGNLAAWNGATYEHDELNQLRHYLNGTQEWFYFYDANDERLWSFKPGTGGTPRFDRWTLRNLSGQVKRSFEVSGYQWTNWTAGNFWEDYIHRGSFLLAGYLSTGPRRHIDVDHLGTIRLVTNAGGATSAFHAFLPYGEEATAFNQDAERMKFTGHERDLADPNGAGDDLDYMHLRACSPLTGRFLELDSVQGAPTQPQSWNRYGYAGGNPLRFVDPNGTEPLEGTRLQFFNAAFNADFSEVDLHRNSSFVPPGFEGITLDQNVFITPDATRKYESGERDGIALVGHELDHTLQFKTYGTFDFLSLYAADYLGNRAEGGQHRTAYRSGGFEVLARTTESAIAVFLDGNPDIQDKLRKRIPLSDSEVARVRAAQVYKSRPVKISYAFIQGVLVIISQIR